MSDELQASQAKLTDALNRIEQLESHFANGERQEGQWRYLVSRPHAWRRQLCIKGRNMTVWHLVGTMRANRLTPEQASENTDLPIDAVREALLYYELNRGLIELEAAEEKRRLIEKGIPLEPEDLRR